MIPIEHWRQRADALRLYGLLAHWHELTDDTWVETLLDWEEAERSRRSLERRLGGAHIGRFKLLAYRSKAVNSTKNSRTGRRNKDTTRLQAISFPRN